MNFCQNVPFTAQNPFKLEAYSDIRQVYMCGPFGHAKILSFYLKKILPGTLNRTKIFQIVFERE